jgi:NAD(P)-dependent dehydrogenase (short-subunit alcohol dehydrogenase family)
MNPTYDFSGQVALVTGAGAGMGLDTARAFAAAGAAVVLADVDEQALRTATDELTDAGHRALGATCDVADEDQVAALVDRTVAEFGRLNMAFNNAGIMLPLADAADEPAESFDRVTAINLRGVWACMKHELRQMRAQGTGAIVNCSSLGGLVGNPGRAALARIGGHAGVCSPLVVAALRRWLARRARRLRGEPATRREGVRAVAVDGQ